MQELFERGSALKSIMRMFSPSGNSQAQNLFAIVAYLQKKENVPLKVKAAHAGN